VGIFEVVDEFFPCVFLWKAADPAAEIILEDVAVSNQM